MPRSSTTLEVSARKHRLTETNFKGNLSSSNRLFIRNPANDISEVPDKYKFDPNDSFKL